MAVGTLISVDEYLHTSYDPDCDYIDGDVLERNLGEIEPSDTQREIILYLCGRYPQLRRRIVPEQRVQVSAARFRIPNVCVQAENAPREKIIKTPPIHCIEILSPEDRTARVEKKDRRLFRNGSPRLLIDPIERRGWIATPGLLAEAKDGILRAGEIEMPLAEILE